MRGTPQFGVARKRSRFSVPELSAHSPSAKAHRALGVNKSTRTTVNDRNQKKKETPKKQKTRAQCDVQQIVDGPDSELESRNCPELQNNTPRRKIQRIICHPPVVQPSAWGTPRGSQPRRHNPPTTQPKKKHSDED